MISNKFGVRSALVSFSLIVFGAIGLAACAAPVGPEEDGVTAGEEQVGAAQEAILTQCCYGTLTCPTTGAHWAWYTGTADCGPSDERYSVASQACNNACVAACTSHKDGCFAN
jgi:hypothetical protein